jgi:aminoglycoside 3-N-acetyltransferase
MSVGWNREDFLDALENIGIEQKDVVFIHSNLGLLGPEQSGKNIAELVLDSLLHFLGQSGSLILPAFTYSHGHTEVFDKKSANGIAKMGILSNKAFEKGFFRSEDPMFSLLGMGPCIEDLLKIEKFNSYGDGSAFRKIIELNSKVLSINMGAGSTLLHEMEHSMGVSYRYQKEFDCQVIDGSNCSIRNIKWKAYVRKMEIAGSEASFSRLTSMFCKTNNWHSVRLGRGQIGAYELKKMENYLSKEVLRDEWLLTDRGDVLRDGG